MVSEKKKVNRVVNFLKKGLSGLADELESTLKGINDFLNSLNKAQKDLKELPAEEEVTVSTSSKKIATQPTAAKSVAASTLFNLLSGQPGSTSKASVAPSAPVTVSALPKAPSSGGPPKAPPGGGPPKVPPGGGPPKAPPGGGPPKAPSGGNLPPAPKLPPAPGSSGPPKAPGAGGAFAKRTPGGGPPSAPPRPGGGTAVAAASTGGGLSSLRDEMLEELTRLKKIMRGE